MRSWREECCLTLTEGTVARADWSPCLSGVLLSSVKRAEHIHLHLLQEKSYSSALTFGSGPKVDEVWASHFPLVYTEKNTFDWWEKDDRRECRGEITFVELCSSKVMYLELGFQAVGISYMTAWMCFEAFWPSCDKSGIGHSLRQDIHHIWQILCSLISPSGRLCN